MEIKFERSTWEEPVVFEIKYFACEYDEDMRPVDIRIGADEQTLEAISEFCIIGCNIRGTQDYDRLPFIATPELCSHIALYGRLKPFTIVKKDLHKVCCY